MFVVMLRVFPQMDFSIILVDAIVHRECFINALNFYIISYIGIYYPYIFVSLNFVASVSCKGTYSCFYGVKS